MNPLAYKTTGLALKFLSALSRARVTLHDAEMVPTDGGTIFVINHFTRLETLLLPYHLSQILERPIWSLAAAELFSGLLGRYLEQVGAVSVGDPERDRLIIRSLVSESTPWIIFPEGEMVKNRKVCKGSDFLIVSPRGVHPPHTGAAVLALRAEILRRRLAETAIGSGLAAELRAKFDLPDDFTPASKIQIVPVNVSYYPLDFSDSRLARFFPLLEEKLSPRAAEELVVEGSMLLEGVDIDIRFGRPLVLAERVAKKFGRRIPAFTENHRNQRFLGHLTRDYMAAIYSLTTVNLDHILAGLLYRRAGREFSKEGLRRRAYLAATSDWQLLGAFPHHSLTETSQVDILLPADQGRVERLLRLAAERGLLLKSGPGGRKRRFVGHPEQCDGSAFHRIRLENPLLVIANTIEPLASLQRLLRWLDRTPEWFLRRRCADRLARFMRRDFLQARSRWADHPKLCPVGLGAPRLHKKGRGTAVVLLHDWLAAPAGLEQLADYLAGRGFAVAVPRLPGHGTVCDDLIQYDYQDWLTAADEAIAWGLCQNRKVVVGGIGRSAALALLAAVRHPREIAALLAIFPNFEVARWSHPGCPSDCEFCYPEAPAASRRQARKMLVAAGRELSRLQTPLLLLEAESTSADQRSRKEHYFRQLGSPEKEFLRLPSPAVDTLTAGPAAGARALVNFISRNLYRRH
jgi:alpha-beta hydrolase superfamily lysophospholipase/1-acyl-sn-glycerol-3-phosphate acyltransferase